MKKTLIITLIDGKVHHRDVSTVMLGAPFGAPANDEAYAKFCFGIAQGGLTDIDNTDESQYTHIAPSQIKTVSLKIEK